MGKQSALKNRRVGPARPVEIDRTAAAFGRGGRGCASRTLREFDRRIEAFGAEAQVDDLDRLVLKEEGVALAIQPAEIRSQRGNPGFRHRPLAGQGQQQLVGLADDLEVGEPGQADPLGRKPLGGQQVPALLLHVLKGFFQPGDIRLFGDDAAGRRHVVVAHFGRQQADRREGARHRRHDGFGHRQLLRQVDRVGAARAAEGDQREIAHVDTALDRDRGDAAGHVGVDDPDDAERRFLQARAHLLRQGADRAFGRREIERHPAGVEIVGVEPAEHQVSVGHGRLGAAQAVAGRAGHGARRVRPDIERAAGIDPGDRTAARADDMQVDDRDLDRQALEIALGRHPRAAVLDQPDIEGRAAHVDRNHAAAPVSPAVQRRRHDPAARAGIDGRHRLFPRHADRSGAAVGLDHGQAGGRRDVRDPGFEIAQVAVHHRGQVGVHRRRRGALVFPVFRAHPVGQGDRHAG